MKLLLYLFLITLVLPSLVHGQRRTWTSNDGKSSFEGQLISATDSSAKIRHANGRTFDLPFERLSQADRDFVQKYIKDQNRAKGLKEGPFADKLSGEWIKVPASEYGILFQIYGDEKKLRRSVDTGFPLFIHLHGAGARGSDVETGKVEIAPQKLVKDYYDDYPCVLIVPTCPENTFWGNHVATLEKLIDTLCDNLPIDRSRVYLSGYSMGARGIGSLIESRPSFYAAGLFADGEAKMEWAGKVDTALWFTFSGERKLAEAEAVAKAHQAAGKIAHFSGHPDHTHNQIHWTLARTDGVYEWLFEKRLGGGETE